LQITRALDFSMTRPYSSYDPASLPLSKSAETEG
jgi:hypothetical protein